MSNTAIWDALAVTDPAHTKQFKRAGGFSGTALKPIWIVKRLTEQFGPAGMGWGTGEPKFHVVPGENREVLVYCNVECWHTSPAHVIHGVGGDKVVKYIPPNPQYNRPERWESDDEAFKKAYTDAVNNAFKFVGVGADIHMGQFDDSKYRDEAAAHFNPPAEKPKRENWGGTYPNKTALHRGLTAHQRDLEGCGDLDMLDALTGTKDWQAFVETAEQHAPHYLYGGDPAPPEFEGLLVQAKRLRDKFNLETANHMADLAHT